MTRKKRREEKKRLARPGAFVPRDGKKCPYRQENKNTSRNAESDGDECRTTCRKTSPGPYDKKNRATEMR